MAGKFNRGVGGAICVVALVWAASAQAIETTYGEDPVPNSECTDDFIDLGYGIDPIPAKSPYVRWQEWRAARGLAPTVGPFKRQQGESRFLSPPTQPQKAPAQSRAVPGLPVKRPVAPSASSSRNSRTKNLSRGSTVR